MKWGFGKSSVLPEESLQVADPVVLLSGFSPLEVLKYHYSFCTKYLTSAICNSDL